MNLEIRANGMKMTKELKAHAEERVRHALRRFREQVTWVRVQFTDLNGPKGGVDIRCKIEARVQAGGGIVVHQTRETPLSALSDATDAVRHSVARRVSRFRDKRRGRRQLRLMGNTIEQN